jgi:hypothetical protein
MRMWNEDSIIKLVSGVNGEKKSYLKSALFKTLTDKGKTKKGQPSGYYRHQKEKLTRSGKIQNGALYRPRQRL